MARARSQNSKLDELIELSRERDRQIGELNTVVAGLAKKIEVMAPTVQQVADAVTFAKVGRTFFRILIGAGAVCVPVLLWMTGRLHLIAQLFKPVP